MIDDAGLVTTPSGPRAVTGVSHVHMPWLSPQERGEGAELLALLPQIIGPIPVEIADLLGELLDDDTTAAGLVLARLRELTR